MDYFKNNVHRLFFFLVLLTFLSCDITEADGPLANEQYPKGWYAPYIGAGNGTWMLSTGVFFQTDQVNFRNLQLRGDVDLYPGIRAHAVVRSNRLFNSLNAWSPQVDEGYFEGTSFYNDGSGVLGLNLKVGSARYIAFPYPDVITTFYRPPGTDDLRFGDTVNAFNGAIATVDYAHKSGLGVHASTISGAWGYAGKNGLLENYLFYRNDFGDVHFETHIGGLMTRSGGDIPGHANGYNVYLGLNKFSFILGGLSGGLLYEKLEGQDTYTGLQITFPLDDITSFLGTVAIDVDRSPAGVATQFQLAKGNIGRFADKAPEHSEQVGEVRAKRLRTYCSNGQVRNYYEHRVFSNGDTTSDGLVVVMEEGSWYLQEEAIYSPNKFDVGFEKWDAQRSSPAQLCQDVTYKFYRKKMSYEVNDVKKNNTDVQSLTLAVKQ